MKVYLDNAATTSLSENTKKYLIEILDIYGNPSSMHSVGDKAKSIVCNARKSVANFINADYKNIYFTSGGSASNTLAIKGYVDKHNCDIFYSPIAHKSILKLVYELNEKGNINTYKLKVDNYGEINVADLEKQLSGCKNNIFVIVDYANSEIGTVQDVKSIIDIVHKYDGVIYLDCTGSISTIPINVKELQVDMCGFSAHKIGGLKGCGVLYKNENIKLSPLIYGNQEHCLIGGTENVLGIASLYKAIENYDYSSINSNCRDYVYDYIKQNINNIYLIGSNLNRLPHNLYICFKGIDGETLMICLDVEGIQVSTGSACNSNSIDISPTLKEIGVNNEDVRSCIRMTFSGLETKEELDYVCEKLKGCIEKLRYF